MEDSDEKGEAKEARTRQSDPRKKGLHSKTYLASMRAELLDFWDRGLTSSIGADVTIDMHEPFIFSILSR